MALTSHTFSTDNHGWAELLPQRKPSKSLHGTHRVPWVVIGAGVTGLSAARRLAEHNPDDHILLLDARRLGQGASGRNSGYAVAISQFSGEFDPEQEKNYRRVERINAQGLNLLRQQVNDHKINCHWHEQGYYHTAADTKSLQEYENFKDHLNRLGYDHTLLGKDELTERLGTSLYQAGIHIPQGVLLQPAALVYGLGDTLPANVTLHENTPVLKINHGEPCVLELTDGQITADNVIVATNYEAPKLGFIKRYIMGSTLSGSFTRQLTKDELESLGSLKEWGVLSLHSGGATVRLTNDKRISLRNTAEYHGAVLMSDAFLAKRREIHRSAFDKRFPQLAQVPFEFSWSGVEGISQNFTNFFGRQTSNIFLAGGYNGSGVSRGTAFGAALADYACNMPSDLVSDCLASAPAKWIPPRPFLDIGAFFKVKSRFIGVGLDR
ncbi:FAD-dependent oxidoreductase [Kiloniella litopenaei]|uniref:FAD-dependent oxidoreductase n=1 Tax=Kiloniella litopenaei TaxID=1549748 RepID=A0A0M2R5V7_9PROT|nr:FAD-dependent oxidoreductase [Kiloniella litopenaei]KKJ75370.1 FAD-dependent oxidoreductase [Kiloniella litopenaei]